MAKSVVALELQQSILDFSGAPTIKFKTPTIRTGPKATEHYAKPLRGSYALATGLQPVQASNRANEAVIIQQMQSI